METHYRFYLLLSYASFFSIIVPLSIGFYCRKRFDAAARMLFYLICASLLAEVCMFGLHLVHVKNLSVLRVYTLVEFTLISLFFIKAIPSPRLQAFIRIMILVFLLVAGGDLYVNGFGQMDNITSAFESIVLMLYTIIAFYYLVVDPTHSEILSNPLFWFYSAILMFYACDMFIFIFSNYIQHHYPNKSFEFFGIHSVNNIIFHLLISLGFWKTTHSK